MLFLSGTFRVYLGLVQSLFRVYLKLVCGVVWAGLKFNEATWLQHWGSLGYRFRVFIPGWIMFAGLLAGCPPSLPSLAGLFACLLAGLLDSLLACLLAPFLPHYL